MSVASTLTESKSILQPWPGAADPIHNSQIPDSPFAHNSPVKTVPPKESQAKPKDSRAELPKSEKYTRLHAVVRQDQKVLVVRADKTAAGYQLEQIVSPRVESAVQRSVSALNLAMNAKRQQIRIAFDKHVDHMNYLRDVSIGENPVITPETASLAKKAWMLIWASTGGKMPIPAACTGPDGQILYAWDRGRHHLELEIFADRAAEFFYKDRETRELWGADYNVGDRIPDEALQKCRFFI